MCLMKTPARFWIIQSLLCVGLGQAQSSQPAATPASGQNSPASNVVTPGTGPAANKPDEDQFTQRIFSNEVNLIFTVTDKHGRFIKDLKQNEFKILDNKKPPSVIRRFEAQTNLPLRVGLLIDASNSIRDRFLFEQRAAIEFLQQIIRPDTDKGFVIAFDEVPEVTQDFTSDRDLLTKGIKVIRPGGGTAMWDAIYFACRDKLMKQREKETTDVRNAIILVSDGDDNQSRALRQEAIEMAQRANVLIYAISTNLSNIHDNGDHNLKLLAEATGGRAFFPFKLQDLADAFVEISGELRSQYSVFYKPDQVQPNQFRTVEVVAEDKKLKVRAKKGYFTPK